MTADPNSGGAHGDAADRPSDRVLVAVFASPVAAALTRYAADLGFRTVLVEPDAARVPAGTPADRTAGGFAELDGELAGGSADVVVTDHHRDELGELLRDALARPARWIGVMGSIRHTAPHVAALHALGVDEADLARIHRPIGLNIGSRTPAEIALSTLAGLLADRNSRPGSFTF